MTEEQRGARARTGLLVAVFLVFVGLIALSVIAVRHSVDGVLTTESEITRESLTHGVERGPNGSLARPGEVTGAAPAGASDDSAQPCPT